MPRVNGHAFTPEPVIDREPIPLPVIRVASPLPAVPFRHRSTWVDGPGIPGSPIGAVALTMSGPYLILSIDLRDGSRIEELVDMIKFTDRWMKDALDAGPTPE